MLTTLTTFIISEQLLESCWFLHLNRLRASILHYLEIQSSFSRHVIEPTYALLVALCLARLLNKLERFQEAHSRRSGAIFTDIPATSLVEGRDYNALNLQYHTNFDVASHGGKLVKDFARTMILDHFSKIP